MQGILWLGRQAFLWLSLQGFLWWDCKVSCGWDYKNPLLRNLRMEQHVLSMYYFWQNASGLEFSKYEEFLS